LLYVSGPYKSYEYTYVERKNYLDAKLFLERLNLIITKTNNSKVFGQIERVAQCRSAREDRSDKCEIRYKLISQISDHQEHRNKIVDIYFNQHEHSDECLYTTNHLKDEKIIELCKMDMKPKYIINQFNKDKGDDALVNNKQNRQKISNLKQRIKEQESLPKIATTHDLLRMFQTLPRISSSISENDEDKCCLVDFTITNTSFKCVLTTRNLIKNIIRQEEKADAVFVTDGTYKLNSNDYPLLVIATVDVERHAHPVAYCICDKENTESYQYFFSAIKTSLKDIFKYTWHPVYTLSDGASYIRKAIINVFDAPKMLMCRFHFSKNLRAKYSNSNYFPVKTIAKEKLKAKYQQLLNGEGRAVNVIDVIKTDIKVLTALHDEDSYLQYWNIIKEFWEEICPRFYDYFLRFYALDTSELHGWQNYFKEKNIGSNCALEACNKHIKEDVTTYLKLPLNDFVTKFMNEVENQSKIEKTLCFSETPFTDNCFWLIGKALAKSFNKYFYSDKIGQHLWYYTSHQLPLASYLFQNKVRNDVKIVCASAEKIKILTNFYIAPTRSQVRHFRGLDNFKSRADLIQRTKFFEVKTGRDIVDSKCSCMDWHSVGVCPHVLAVLIQENKIEAPQDLRINLRRGRRKKVDPALIHGNTLDATSTLDVSDEEDEEEDEPKITRRKR
jgi:uncharacterized protein with PQ loop repeat